MARYLGDMVRARSLEDQALEAARRIGDRRTEVWVRVTRATRRVITDPSDATRESLLNTAREAVVAFEQLGDDRRLGGAWRLVAWVERGRLAVAAAEDALAQSLAHARTDFGKELTLIEVVQLLFFGPRPASEAIRRAEELVSEFVVPSRRARAEGWLANLYALAGRLDEARRLVREAELAVADSGPKYGLAEALFLGALVEVNGGDPRIAETLLRRSLVRAEEAGDKTTGGDALALLGRVLFEQGRLEEAEACVDSALEGGIDAIAAVPARGVKARALAHRGEAEAAERLARQALESVAGTDCLTLRSEAGMNLADVLALAGRVDEARSAAEEALRLAERKEDIVTARNARERLASLGRSATPPRSRARPSSRR
jgi:tetratricopeptide (TPR) repeat protein